MLFIPQQRFQARGPFPLAPLPFFTHLGLMRLLLIVVVPLILSSCVHLLTTTIDYTSSEAAPRVGGSAFRAEFIPRGSESGLALSAMVVGGATIAEVGPYQVRLHAFGRPGDQRSFRILRFVLSSPGNFTAPMEPRGFEGSAEFQPTRDAARTRASLLLGPLFRLDERRDRELLLEADVEVTRRSGVSRGTIKIPLQQTKSRHRESEFILAELWDHSEDSPDSIPHALPPPPESP